MVLGATLSQAQVLGEKAELVRLEEKAEDAIAQGDPNGAALNIGKAALMASLLAEKETDLQTRQIYNGAEALFRAQENGYRALALFEQAGGELPPPSGVCQLVGLAQQNGNIATKRFGEITLPAETMAGNLHARLNTKTTEWLQILEELRTDFSCTQ